MKKLFLILLISITFLQAFTYYLKDGWQMIGTTDFIRDKTIFDDTCTKEIWRYDHIKSIWQNYILSDKLNTTILNLPEGKGYWLKADGNCSITIPIFLSLYKEKGGEIINDYNESKRFEVISDSDRFNELDSKYKSNTSLIPYVNFEDEIALFLRNRGQISYTQSFNAKLARVYEDYTEILIETKVKKGECTSTDDRDIAPFIFYSMPKKHNIILKESMKIESCDKYGNLVEVDIGDFEEIPFSEVDLMTYKSYGDTIMYKRLEVVQNLEVFKYLYYSYIYPHDTSRELPEIDFEKNTLLAIFMGVQPATRYYIEVERVKEYENYIEVEVNNIYNSCQMQSPAESSPVTFVTIPKTDKEILFNEYVTFRCE